MGRRIVALMLAVALVAVHDVREGAARCSKRVAFGPKWPGTAYVLGAARPDTILAGRGPVDYVTGDGHFGRGTDRAIYGQLFLVERIGTPASESLPSSVASALMVPWDYGANCRPSPWTRSARWLPVGERGVVTGALRERRYWIDGIPTLDVHMPEAQPYPLRGPKPALPDSALTAEELFTLLEMVPDAEAVGRAPREAIVPLREWLQANPAIARRWPANETAMSVHYSAEMAILENTVPVVGGTYRFSVARPGRDSAVFFVRTYSRATTWWHRPPLPKIPLAELRDPESYTVLVATALSEEALATRDTNGVVYMERQGYFGLFRDARERPDGGREWAGRVDLDPINETLLADLGIGKDGVFSLETQGSFVMDPQGRIRVEMIIGQSGGKPVMLRGERISTVMVDSRW